MIVLRQFNLVIAPQSSPWPTLVNLFLTVVLRDEIALAQRAPASINRCFVVQARPLGAPGDEGFEFF